MRDESGTENIPMEDCIGVVGYQLIKLFNYPMEYLVIWKIVKSQYFTKGPRIFQQRPAVENCRF